MNVSVVTLCGSTRYLDKFNEANRELTKRGLSVISISTAIEKDESGNEKEPGLKEVLDLVHFNKILRSDAVLVVGNHIGFSTSREILWANMQGKPFLRASRYLEDGTLSGYDQITVRLQNGDASPDLLDEAFRVLMEHQELNTKPFP